MSHFADTGTFLNVLNDLPLPDDIAREQAAARQQQLTKPPGSLGRLEEIALFLAGWQGRAIPRADTGRAIVFAGNHGVVAQGVSAFPAAVTAQMVGNFERGGAAINALAGAAGLELVVEAIDLDRPTGDFTLGAAMSDAELLDALNRGAARIEAGLDFVVLGEMGIGNSTAAAALCAASLGGAPTDWVGPGTGVDASGVARKAAAVAAGLTRHAGSLTDPVEILRRLGGREIAAIAGAVVAARLAHVPVILDGFICSSALAPLAAHQPAITAHCIAGHVSAEPGHVRLLARLGLSPLLSLDMRLGEGSGAALAAGVVRAAVATHAGMATFAEAGVSQA